MQGASLGEPAPRADPRLRAPVAALNQPRSPAPAPIFRPQGPSTAPTVRPLPRLAAFAPNADMHSASLGEPVARTAPHSGRPSRR
jgi:hypothetical protein